MRQVSNGHCTPNGMEVMLYYYYSGQPHPRRYAPAVQEAIDGLIAGDLLRPSTLSGSGLQATERGKAWVELLGQTPFPVSGGAWLDPRNGKVIEFR